MREGLSWRVDLCALAGAVALTVLLSFFSFGMVERVYVKTESDRNLLHSVRGISTSLAAATAVGLLGYTQHRRRTRTLREEALRAAREAQDARALLHLIVEATPAGLIVLDPEYRVVMANQAARNVHGRELSGEACWEAVTACSTFCEHCPAAATQATGRARTDLPVHTDSRTGEVLAIETHPLSLPNGERYVLLVERVITEQKKLQARLLHQERMAALGLMAAGVAHDLGNPIASIDAQLQLLEAEGNDCAASQSVSEVRLAVRRLGRMLHELTGFARRRRDEAALISVQAVVEDALRILRYEPRSRCVSIKTRFDRETPSVMMIEDHLMQVVLNLLLNALDAMPDKGTIEIELGPGPPGVVLKIRDTGCGIDHSILERCFEPLFTTKPAGNGTGLGLTISRDIIRENGGQLELESSPGSGTTAKVCLPAARVDSSWFEERSMPS